MIFQERIRGTHAGHLLYSGAAATNTRALLFQLVWSLAVAESKLGFQHRDMTIRNMMIATLETPQAEQYTLHQQGQQHPTVFEMGPLQHRLVLLDYGKSDHWDAAAEAPALAPDVKHSDLGSLPAPEDYFVTRKYAHGFLSERHTLGLVAFSLLAAPHLFAVLTAAEMEHLKRHISIYAQFDLVNLLPRLIDSMLPKSKRPGHEIFSQFKTVLDSALRLIGIRAGSPEDTLWRRRIHDSQHNYGQVYENILGQILLKRALFGANDGILPPFDSAMVRQPLTSSMHIWYRLLAHKSVRAFWERPEVRDLEQRCYAGLLARLADADRHLLQQLLMWQPEDRPPTLAAVLAHPVFTSFRQTRLANLPIRFYSWHAQPPLERGAPQLQDKQHMASLRQAIKEAYNIPMLAAEESFEEVVADFAESLASRETGL
jgi:hypothetical protein